MIGTVEVFDLTGGDEFLLDGSQGSRGTSAYHECASVDILIRDNVLFGQGIVLVSNKVDPGVKELVNIDARDMLSLLDESKEDVGFVF